MPLVYAPLTANSPMVALPNLGALRLGQRPEVATGGQRKEYRSGELGTRAATKQHRSKVPCGTESDCISLEDFKDGDPIWVGESGHYYYPWTYYRAAKEKGRRERGPGVWLDPLTNTEVSSDDQETLYHYLKDIARAPPKEHPEYAVEAEAVLEHDYGSEDPDDYGNEPWWTEEDEARHQAELRNRERLRSRPYWGPVSDDEEDEEEYENEWEWPNWREE